MALYHLGSLVRIHFDISDLRLARLHDFYDRLILAKTDTAGLGNGNFIGQALFLNQSGKGI